jgi:hypothetical protein
MAEFAADTIIFIKVPSMDMKATGGKPENEIYNN